MSEPDMTEDAMPIIDQAMQAVEGMDPGDWVACALVEEVESLRTQLGVERYHRADAERREQWTLEALNKQQRITQRAEENHKAWLTELLNAIGVDPLRDWDDLLNAVKCIENERRYLKTQAQYVLELANQATPVLVGDPLDCTGKCYEGPDCDCSGVKVERAWDLNPAVVRDAMTGRSNDLMLPWDNLLNTVFWLKADRDEARDQLQRQNEALIKSVAYEKPDTQKGD